MNFRGSLRDSMRGFTLVELMVVITVMAVLASIAIPSMTQLLARHRIQNAALELQSSILQARSFAATQGRPVEMWPAYTSGAGVGSSVWNVLSVNRGSTVSLPAAETNATSIAALQAAKLSWYVVTPCTAGSSAATVCPSNTTGTIATIATSTANSYPIQISLPDQTQITVGAIISPSTATPSVTGGIRFFPSGYIGNITTGAQAYFSQVSFRVCDTAISGEQGYTVIVSQFGTVRAFMGPNPDTTDAVGSAACA